MNNQKGPQLLILDKKVVSRSRFTYLGVNRYTPSYQESYPPDSRVNQAFRWFCEYGGESGIVHDLESAKELVRQYKLVSSPVHLQIIEPVLEGARPVLGSEFLGWDLALHGIGFSLVLGSIHEMDPDAVITELGPIEPLARLARKHFGKLLNQNGLFGELADARFCRDCFGALDQLRPGLFESDPFKDYKIVGVYVVSDG
jgi:hypothetical protein